MASSGRETQCCASPAPGYGAHVLRSFATILILFLALAGAGRGEALIYDGMFKLAVTGAGQTFYVAQAEYFVFDPEFQRGTSVEYGIDNGRKVYVVRATRLMEFFLVKDAEGRVFSLLPDPSSDELPRSAAGFLVLKGLNEEMAIGGGMTRSVARSMRGPARLAGHTSGTAVTATGNVNLQLNLELTTSANDEYSSHQEAVNRVIRHLRNRGYQAQ